MRAAAFLDRDGVINIDHGYVSRIENFDFIEGVQDAAAELCKPDAGQFADIILSTGSSGEVTAARGPGTE